MKRLALLLALALCLCACTATPAETTLPPETTAPTETAPINFCPDVIVDPTFPIIEYTEHYEFEDYYALLEWPDEGFNWLRDAMGCVFETPEQINLEFLFYSGFRLGSWDLLSSESEQYLIDNGFWREMDIQPMPAEQLEQVLQDTFGISLSDCTIPDGWLYLEKEDFYCSNHNDAYMLQDFIITNVTESPDGIVKIHYFVEDYYNTITDDFLYTVDLILTLRKTEDGFLAISNVPANQSEYDTLYDRELIDIISTEEALAVWAASDAPGSAEGLEYLASLSPAFTELMTRSSAPDTFSWYGPERIAELKADPETVHSAEHLAMLIACLSAP